MGDLLVVTGGHRVDQTALSELFDDVSDRIGWRWAHAVQPGAQRWLAPGTPWDVIVLHDIAGLRLTRGTPPVPESPSAEVRHDVEALLEQGRGLVVVHHALASWPDWDGWADAIGGRFFYAPGRLRGRSVPSSGTCLTRYRVAPVAGDHPVLDDLGEATLDDEPYLCPVFEDEVEPLLRGDFDLDGAAFVSTYEHVLVGEDEAPRCAGRQASALVAWVTSAGSSPIVYIQPGDSGATFSLPWYRKLMTNAVLWAGSPEAQAWAEERNRSHG